MRYNGLLGLLLIAGCTPLWRDCYQWSPEQDLSSPMDLSPPIDLSPPQAEIRVRKHGLGMGTVTSDPPGIDCGATCSASFTVGTHVILLVKPDSRAYFMRYGGACSGMNCTATAGMAGEVEVHLGARFCEKLRPGQGAICSVDPPTGAPNLKALWGSSGDDLWASGANGSLLYYDGFAWTPVPNGSKGDLTGIWGSGPNDVYIVGSEWTIRHWDGTRLTQEAPPAGTLFAAVGGVDAGDVWIAGETILHREGGVWMQKNQTQAGSPVPDNLHAIWASGKDDIWAAGNSGVIWHWKGAAWEGNATPSTKPVYALWGRDANEVWAAGYPETGTVANLLRWDGMKWSRVEGNPKPPVSTYHRIWGRKNEIFAVGIAGLIRWDGTGWARDDKVPKDDASQFAVWADDDNIVVAGRAGNIMRKRGSSDFVQEHVGGKEHDGRDLNGVWAFSPAEVWAVGDKGLVRRFDGSTWSSVVVPSEVRNVDLRAIWGTGPDNLWIAGKVGTVLHLTKTGWKNLTNPNHSPVYEAVYGINPENIWLVGSQGQTLRCKEDETCEVIPSGVTRWLQGVWGSSANDIWAVGESSTVLRFDPINSKWIPVAGAPVTDLYGVCGQGSAGDVWMVGANSSLVLRYKRAAGLFERVSLPPEVGGFFQGVHCASDIDMWVVDSYGGIVHMDDQGWAYQKTSATSFPLYGVHGNSGEVWAVGYGGVILHYPH